MGVFEFHSNDHLVNEVERGLRKGYWDKALIPELKKRFIELEKKEKLLEELKNDLARYFELANNEETTKEVLDEFSEIRNKLMKVGI